MISLNAKCFWPMPVYVRKKDFSFRKLVFNFDKKGWHFFMQDDFLSRIEANAMGLRKKYVVLSTIKCNKIYLKYYIVVLLYDTIL